MHSSHLHRHLPRVLGPPRWDTALDAAGKSCDHAEERSECEAPEEIRLIARPVRVLSS
jgi:hypothetical protein